MREFEAEVKVKIKVVAYDESDAKELIEDTFGPGEDCGITITDTRIAKLKES